VAPDSGVAALRTHEGDRKVGRWWLAICELQSGLGQRLIELAQGLSRQAQRERAHVDRDHAAVGDVHAGHGTFCQASLRAAGVLVRRRWSLHG